MPSWSSVRSANRALFISMPSDDVTCTHQGRIPRCRAGPMRTAQPHVDRCLAHQRSSSFFDTAGQGLRHASIMDSWSWTLSVSRPPVSGSPYSTLHVYMYYDTCTMVHSASSMHHTLRQHDCTVPTRRRSTSGHHAMPVLLAGGTSVSPP